MSEKIKNTVNTIISAFVSPPTPTKQAERAIAKMPADQRPATGKQAEQIKQDFIESCRKPTK